jgi:hypothetical protein
VSASAQHSSLEDVSDHLVEILSSPMYYPCVLLMARDVARLHFAARGLTNRLGWPLVSMGEMLCAALLDLPRRRRPQAARQAVVQQIERLAPGPLLCSDIDLLFDPALDLDPLYLLREASRQTPLAVFWPGAHIDGLLSYAVPDHAHYRTWRQTELCPRCIISL